MVRKTDFLPVIVFAKVAIRRQFRDKVAMFFTFLFPLLFLFVFGAIFSNDSGASFDVALINQSKSEFAQQFVASSKDDQTLKVADDVSSLEAARERMSRGQLSAAIVLPEGFGDPGEQGYPVGEAKLYYTQNNEQAAQMLQSIMAGIFKDINNQLAPYTPPFTVASEQLSVKSLSSLDYLFSGLLGFSLIGLGIFGPISYFPELKKQGVLRRLQTTPLRVWQYFLASVLSNIVIGLLSVATLFIAARVFFDLQMAGNLAELAVFVTIGIALMLGIGLALGGWARNERQAAPLGQLVVFPMMFLSGTFWPRFLMPDLLQKISAFLPLTPFVDGARLIVAEGQNLVQVGPHIATMLAWIVVIYALAFRFFRWE
ncbi:hypothetical protein CR970_00370 [Candidatus Saccharibacteria bacterium]|nr:MAG: hypothetical protein CR970_00370 [Candidatus Saccharibacteria bacterium]